MGLAALGVLHRCKWVKEQVSKRNSRAIVERVKGRRGGMGGRRVCT